MKTITTIIMMWMLVLATACGVAPYSEEEGVDILEQPLTTGFLVPNGLEIARRWGGFRQSGNSLIVTPIVSAISDNSSTSCPSDNSFARQATYRGDPDPDNDLLEVAITPPSSAMSIKSAVIYVCAMGTGGSLQINFVHRIAPSALSVTMTLSNGNVIQSLTGQTTMYRFKTGELSRWFYAGGSEEKLLVDAYGHSGSPRIYSMAVKLSDSDVL